MNELIIFGSILICIGLVILFVYIKGGKDERIKAEKAALEEHKRIEDDVKKAWKERDGSLAKHRRAIIEFMSGKES